MKSKNVSAGIVLVLLCLMATGCFSSRPEAIQAFARTMEKEVTADHYLLRPPDEIQIFAAEVPELHQATQIIRPDGMISFEGLGEFPVSGKTPAQAAEMIRTKAIELYSLAGDHPIDVRIELYRSKLYYVLGQVGHPGPKIHTGRISLLSAIAEADPQVTGWTKRIQVIRPSEIKDQKPSVFEINYNKMIVHGDLSKNVLLQEGDIVYVPPTPLAYISLIISEFARPIGQALAPAVSVQRLSGP